MAESAEGAQSRGFLSDGIPYAVGLDYVKASADFGAYSSLGRWMRKRFGEPHSVGRTRMGEEAEFWGTACVARKSSWARVELDGGFMGPMDGRERLGLLRSLIVEEGCRARRLDVAVDRSWDGDVGIFREMKGSPEVGTLCGVRNVGDLIESKPNPHGHVGRTCYVGDRKQPVCGRLYDKGVRECVAGPGRWLRWELELKREHAEYVGAILARLDDDGAEAFMVQAAFSYVDFRDVTGRTSLSARPRCVWWDRFAVSPGGSGRPLGRVRDVTYAESRADRLRRVYPSLVALANAVGMTVVEFVGFELEGASVRPRELPRRMVESVRAAVAGMDPFETAASMDRGLRHEKRRA